MSEREFVEYTDPVTGRQTFGYRDTKVAPPAPNFEVPTFKVKDPEFHRKGGKVSRQVPLWHPDAPSHDHMGRARFASTGEMRKFMEKTGATNDGASLESGDYENQVEDRKKAQAILPCEEEWQSVKHEARKSGDLPMSASEPPVETRRRKKAATRRKKKGDL